LKKLLFCIINFKNYLMSYLFMRMLFVISTFTRLIYASEAYVEVGCFADKHTPRAISGKHATFATSVVKDMCYHKAKTAGNSYFAVQDGTDCFTSSDAGTTYDKYGRSTGCKNGVGAFSEMTVYWIPAGAFVIHDTLKEMDTNLAAEWEGAVHSCAHSGNCNGNYNGAGDLVVTVATALKEGAELFEAFSNVITNKKFVDIAQNIGKVSAVLGGAGAVVSLVSTFAFADSQDLKLDLIIDLLTDGFNRIEDRFDALENQLQDLEDVINEQHFKTRIRPSLLALRFCNTLVTDWFEFPSDERKRDLIDCYDEAYSAIVALRDEFIGEHDSPLCERLIDYSNVDRQKVLFTLTDLYSRLVRGVSDLVRIANLKGRTDISFTVSKMDNWLRGIANSIQKCDIDLASKRWLEQWGVDRDRVLKGTKKITRALGTRVNYRLSSKYYWRDWLVVGYDYLRGSKNRAMTYCRSSDVFLMNSKKRYALFISSVPKAKSKEAYKPTFSLYSLRINSAYGILKKLPSHKGKKCRYQLVGVVRRYREKVFIIHAPSYRRWSQGLNFKKCKRFWFHRQCWSHMFTAYVLG